MGPTQDLRERMLAFAQNINETPEQVVARAQAYTDFAQGPNKPQEGNENGEA